MLIPARVMQRAPVSVNNYPKPHDDPESAPSWECSPLVWPRVDLIAATDRAITGVDKGLLGMQPVG